MSRSSARSLKRRAAVLSGIGFATLAFVACGGRTDLSPPGESSGSSGISGVGAEGGLGGAFGRGGAAGNFGSGGGSVGGSGGFGGASGFGGSSSFGGSSGFGGAAGSFAGSGGAGGDCSPPPRFECEYCHCRSCPVEWTRCQQDLGCAEISACIAATGCVSGSCYLDGHCRGPIDRHGGISSNSTVMAITLDNCWRGAGCTCTGGVGGAAGGVGFGGSAGFGGSFGFGGSAGSGVCGNVPGECANCMCNACSSQYLACTSDQRCIELSSCVMTNCVLPGNGNCSETCAREIAAAIGTPAMPLAQNFVTCILNAINGGCPCGSGFGGASGFGGVGGFGGTGFGGAAGSGTFDCTTCLSNACPVVQDCLNAPFCAPGFQCSVNNCYQGGGAWDPGCIVGCYSYDPDMGREMAGGLQCVTTTCRPWCGTPTGS
jgi:hypothetical protein